RALLPRRLAWRRAAGLGRNVRDGGDDGKHRNGNGEDRVGMAEHAIDIQGVRHEYEIERDGARHKLSAIAEASLTIKAGEFVSLVGPSGCGKTTLLNMVAGLIEVQQGRILLAGQPPRIGREDVAYMFASDCLLPWRTTLRNAAFGMELRGFPHEARLARAKELLGEAGLSGFESTYVGQLSKGMRQRVALASSAARSRRPSKSARTASPNSFTTLAMRLHDE